MSSNARRLAHATLHRILIEPCIQRDLILEQDAVFCMNARQLKHRAVQRKIDVPQYKAIHGWLVAAALRRAHVPLQQARRMALA